MKELKNGDRVRLTGWSKWFIQNKTPYPSALFSKEGHVFPCESVVTVFDDETMVLSDWGLGNFEYELLPEKETPAFAHNVPVDQFNWICAQMGLTPTDGVQPGTKQAVIYAPNGTPTIYLTCQIEPDKKIGVRVTTIEEI